MTVLLESIAYQLLEDVHQVLVIDCLPPGILGASYRNAGLIATGHCIAWGSPKTLKMMKFQVDPQFIRWGLKFLFQCTEYKAKRNSLAKHRISSFSQKKLKEVVEETNIQDEHMQMS